MNWKTGLVLLCAAAILIQLPVSKLFSDEAAEAPAAEVAVQWGTDYQEALAAAKAANRRVLVDFTGSDWCHWCKVMEAEVLTKPEFLAYAGANLVLLKVDFPRARLPEPLASQNDALARKYNVRGFPCFVVLDPLGAQIDRHSGAMRGGPSAFISFLERTGNALSPSVAEPAFEAPDEGEKTK
jgi:protein disulfide-isomerase